MRGAVAQGAVRTSLTLVVQHIADNVLVTPMPLYAIMADWFLRNLNLSSEGVSARQ